MVWLIEDGFHSEACYTLFMHGQAHLEEAIAMCQVKEFGLQAMESVNAAQQSSLQHSLTQVGVVQSRGCCSQHSLSRQ